MFGYDTGVLASILEFDKWKSYFHHPGSIGVGVIVSALTAGCFVGSLIAGRIADKYSRKRTIMIACVVFSLGAAIQCGSINRAMLIVGRFISGLGVGVLSMTVPMFQSELAPPAIRGRLVSFQQWAITWGIVVSYWVDYGLHFVQSDVAWRVPIGIQIVPAAVLFVAMFFMPYSPRWLVNHGLVDEAHVVLAKLRAMGDLNAPDVVTELEEIKESVQVDGVTAVRSYTELFHVPIRRRVLIGIAVHALSQLSGINVTLYFAPTIFKQSGLTGKNASLLAQGLSGVVNCLFTIPAILWIDRWGRRKTLMFGSLGCGIAYFVQAVATGATQHKTFDENGDLYLNLPTGPSY
ncbi:high affinity glucose transporter, partial [Coemansia sp. RSA 522]